MELSTALENIRHTSGKFAEEEVLCIRANKEAAIPALLELVRGAKSSVDVIPEAIDDIDDPAYAMFLLAEFKVSEAFEPIIRLLELDEERCEWLLGDMITEDMGPIIASVARADDIGRIKAVVENAAINEFQRGAALTALTIMYSEGIYTRAEFMEYLGYLLDKCEDDGAFVTSIIVTCDQVSAREHYGRVRDLFKAGKVDEFMIGAKHFDKNIPEITAHEVINKLKERSYTSVISDTVSSMKWWACFNEKPVGSRQAKASGLNNYFPQVSQTIVKEKKIGRNAPCPCGSGKKYKNCCLNKAK